MGESTEKLKQEIIQSFPKLAGDKHFKITSPQNVVYNCIAWACIYDDRWIQPPSLNSSILDGIIWWPPGIPEGMEPDCLVKLFESKGYEKCDSPAHEVGFRKVALFYNEQNNNWTHAARELSNGFWTSKLGQLNDIQHGTPETVENEVYGVVFCFMKREFK